MTTDLHTPNQPEPVSRTIAKLCLGGDWACAHGDLEALGDIATRLAGYTPETLHCDLLALADLCRCDPDGAVSLWMQLKEQVREAPRPPS